MQSGNIQNSGLGKLVTVAGVAAILNVSERFVRDHAREMGAIRIGGGRRRAGRLRFTSECVSQFIAQRDFRPRVARQAARR